MRQPVIACSDCPFEAQPDTLGQMEAAFLSHVCTSDAAEPDSLPDPAGS